MGILDIAKERYSVRSYKKQKVEKEKLDQILEAGRVAPSAKNLQPVRLIVVQEEEGLKKISKAARTYNAPLAVIVCSDHEKEWVRPYDNKQSGDIDASIVTDHMMLQAAELGLGTVWICYFKPQVLTEEFSLPENLEPVNILVIGYADGEKQSPDRHDKTRVPLSEMLYEYK